MIFQQDIELQELFITQLLATVGPLMFLQELPSLVFRPLKLMQHLITLLDEIAALNWHRCCFRSLLRLDLT